MSSSADAAPAGRDRLERDGDCVSCGSTDGLSALEEDCSESLLESVVVDNTSSTASLIHSAPPSYVQAVMNDMNVSESDPPAYEEIYRESVSNAASAIREGGDYGAYFQLLKSWGCVAMMIISVIVILTLMALTLTTALSFRRV
ncbi:b42.2 [miniopterid betaherpesvirus 1]|uniref:B42.2 n=1 Tax=miniopterid betaherpesvirus 1 TaxID=3070189 RepID=I3VQ25_9BETA|nr:b42.2 [miniopterid betaherpesvirus 1]AFK83869.1 b42.2 [miniopterid betaherpesvirus 1]